VPRLLPSEVVRLSSGVHEGASVRRVLIGCWERGLPRPAKLMLGALTLARYCSWVLPIFFIASTAAAQPCTTSTHHERWKMKNRAAVDTEPGTSTVADILQWPVPAVANWRQAADGPLLPQEHLVVEVTGYVRLVKISPDDCDLHIQLADSPTQDPAPQLIVEIPLTQPQARQELAQLLGFAPTKKAKRLKGAAAIKIAATGWVFLDLSHATNPPTKAGHAHGTADVRTLWEIHPVFKVEAAR
jgi:hypothetical protein